MRYSTMQRKSHGKLAISALCWLLVLASLSKAITPVTILQPDGGTFIQGDSLTVKWVYPPQAAVVLYISLDDGFSFRDIMFDHKILMSSDTGVIKWPIPIEPKYVSTTVRIQIYDYDQYLNQGISNPFAIVANTSIRRALLPKSISIVNPAHTMYSLKGTALKHTVFGRVPGGVYVTGSKSGAAQWSPSVIAK
jgi:hypothetical protein